MRIRLCLCGILLCSAAFSYGQHPDSQLDKITDFPNRIFDKIRNKTSRLDSQLTRQTEKYLDRLAKGEKKLQRELSKTDSVAAKKIFSASQEEYRRLAESLDSSSNRSSVSGEYLSYIDSLKESLSFLKQNHNLLNASPNLQDRINASAASCNYLQSKLQSADQIKEYISERKEQLKIALNNYVNSTRVKKILDDYNRQVYYYSQQIREYKSMLNDPDKMEREALSILDKIPAFQDFMKNNSQLSSLFNIPGNYGSTVALQGLQTRDQITQLIQTQVGNGGFAALTALQNNIGSAEQMLDHYKNNLQSFGQTGSTNMDIPDFNPNTQKTKTFLKRLEYGTNLQTARTSYYFPTTTDIGLSLGYKLNDKSTAGLGMSYKIGWGSAINHISVSSQGIGLRSFLDIKLKGNTYISGGFEENYQQPFSEFSQINSFSCGNQAA